MTDYHLGWTINHNLKLVHHWNWGEEDKAMIFAVSLFGQAQPVLEDMAG